MFKTEKNSIIVTAPIIEVYLPYDYYAAELFERVGENIRYYGVANFKVFNSEKERENKPSVKTYPMGISSMLIARPTETDTMEVQFTKGGKLHKCIVMTFYKNDLFLVEKNIIKNTDNAFILMNRLEAGKLDNVPPNIQADMLMYAQVLNKINFGLPSELLEIFVSEKYRDPSNPSRKYRFADASKIRGDDVVSYNMREDAMQSTAYQGFTHEDINTALITAINRKHDGIVDEPTYMERIIKGEKIDK